jgi:catechol 2,3-dioxygenase
MTERIQDVSSLGRLELLTPKLDLSRSYFESVLGMEVASDEGRLIYLRGHGGGAASTLKLTESDGSGIGYVSWRAASPEALERRVYAIQRAGLGDRWDSGDFGRGPAYRFRDPDGRHMEIYYVERNTGRPA